MNSVARPTNDITRLSALETGLREDRPPAAEKQHQKWQNIQKRDELHMVSGLG